MALSEAQKTERAEYLGENLEITECSQKQPYVFISYASHDWEAVFKTAIIPMQKQYGLRVYADKAFDEVNDKWIVPMLRNLRGSDMMVAFVSQNYIESYACFLELLTAVNNKKQIVFVSLEENLHLGDTTDQPVMERGIKNEILNQGANIATNTNNTSNDVMRAMKSAYTSISTLLEQDALSKYDISDAFINFFRDSAINRKTINNLTAVRITMHSISPAVFDQLPVQPVDQGNIQNVLLQTPQGSLPDGQPVFAQQNMPPVQQEPVQQNWRPAPPPMPQQLQRPAPPPMSQQGPQQFAPPSGQLVPGGGAKKPKSGLGKKIIGGVAALLVFAIVIGMFASPKKDNTPSRNDVPEGYISIAELRALLEEMSLPAGTLEGLSTELSDSEARAIDEAVAQMESSYLAAPPADATPVTVRDWSRYGSQLSKARLNIHEAAFYDRLDEMCRSYIESAAMDAVKYGTYNVMKAVKFSDLDLDKEQAGEIAFWFMRNNPQYYFLRSSIIKTSGSIYFCMYDFSTSGEERAQLTNKMFDKLDGWIDSVNDDEVTTWQKEVSASRLLCDEINYKKNDTDQSIYSVLMTGDSVCAGYAETFSAIMNASGVDTVVATSSNHAWNVIRLDDGNFYGVDVTWADGRNDINFLFNVGEPELKSEDDDSQPHTNEPSSAAWAPQLSQTSYTPTAYDRTGTGANAAAVSLRAPENLRVSADKDGKISFAWDRVSDASQYTVEIYTADMSKRVASGTVKNAAASVTYGSYSELAVRVRAETEVNGQTYSSDWSAPLTAKTKASQSNEPSAPKLDAPKNVKATKVEADAITLSWDKVADAEKYQAMLFKDAAHTQTWVSGFTEKAISFSKLQANTTYYFGVRSMKTVNGQEVYSDWTYFTQKTAAAAAAAPAVPKPGKLTGLNAYALTDETARVTWNVAEHATGYQLRVYKDSGYKEVSQETVVTGTALRLNSVKIGRTYYIGVRAVNASEGQEVYSDWVNISYTHTGVSVALSAPSNVQGNAVDEISARITWNAVDGATGYQLRVYKDSSRKEVRAESDVKGTSLRLNKVKGGTTYYIGVRAVKTAEGQADVYSDWVQITYTHTKPTTLAAPGNLKAAAEESAAARLSWDAVTGATGYQVQIYKDAGHKEIWTESNSASTTPKLNKLTDGTTYYIGVRAVKSADGQADVYSDWSYLTYTHKDPALAPPAAPGNLQAAATESEAARITWDAAAGATGYQLQVYKDASRKEVRAEKDVSKTALVLNGLKDGSVYYIGVRAARAAEGQETVYSEWTYLTYTHKAPNA